MADADERIRFLKTVPLMSGVEDSDLPSIAAAMHELSFPADKVIFREKDPGDFMYIIVKGSVRIVKGTTNPLVLAILNSKEFFGEMALFDQEARSATVEAQEDVTLLGLEGARFLQLLSKYPRFGLALVRTLAGRLREMHQEVLNARAQADFFRQKAEKA